jgi:hypothetical protein
MTGPARYGGFPRNASAPTLKLRFNDFFNEIGAKKKFKLAQYRIVLKVRKVLSRHL